MNGLFEMLCVDDRTYLSSRIRGPVWCNDFNSSFTYIKSGRKLAKINIEILIGWKYSTSTSIIQCYLFDFGSVGGFAAGRSEFDCRLLRHLLKYESPWGAVISGTPGDCRFRFEDSCCGCSGSGGRLKFDVWKSPYIRRINALFSSINSSIRSLKLI